MRLTQAERETIIRFDETGEPADIYTYNKSLITKLDRMCAKSLDIHCIQKGIGWAEYSCPKKWIKVQMPKQLSEERRTELAKQAYQRFYGSKDENR